MKSNTKVGRQKVKTEEGSVIYSAIEDFLQLETILHYDLRGRSVGALMNRQGNNRYQFTFGFACQGIHSTLKPDERNSVFDAIESGLKDLPGKERLTIHLSSFSDDVERQIHLDTLIEKASSDEIKFLLWGEKARVQELTQLGIRKPKPLYVYVTYTVDPTTSGGTDHIEKGIAWFQSNWHKFLGEHQSVEQERYEDLFSKAFTDGFQIWEQLLSTKMGLNIRPLLEDELWSNLWKRFNTTECPPIPQRIIMSEEGISEEINAALHATTHLVGNSAALPKTARDSIRVKGKYVGALTFLEKPAGWSNKYEQLRYLWSLISRDQVTDTEVFCEFSRANDSIVKTNMQRITKQSIVQSDLSASKSSVDVASNIKTRRAVQAQEKLYEGAIPINVAVVILVHRKTRSQLDEACRYLQSCVRLPAIIDREREYAWLIWLQTLPITWDALLLKPFNRRMVYLSDEAPGFLPLITPKAVDKTGFELITEEGGTPLFLDLFTQHKNLGIFATTRAGKSVLVSGILTQAMACGMPIVALDFPKPDGSSTFTDYTNFMGAKGAYFDISTESNNLFEMPDLRRFTMEQQSERLKEYQDFLLQSMLLMVMGSAPMDSAEIRLLRNTVRSLLTMFLGLFLQDAQILVRYDAAIAGGFGSPAWSETPTLADFIRFCNLQLLDEVSMAALSGGGGNVAKAMESIHLQLRFWLNSRVGQSIARPSSFPTDAQLLVFALRNLNEAEDAAILALSAYSAALRRSLSCPASIFFIDEAPVLFEFDAIAALVARICANGAKAGSRVILSGQDPDTIARSPSASKILQNLSTRLIGRIEPVAIASFERVFNYPREIISRNAGESFFPRKEGIYSQWLLDDKDTYTYCRYYPAYVQLGAVANNPNEQSARTAFNANSANKFRGLSEFSHELVSALKDNRSIHCPTVIEPQVHLPGRTVKVLQSVTDPDITPIPEVSSDPSDPIVSLQPVGAIAMT